MGALCVMGAIGKAKQALPHRKCDERWGFKGGFCGSAQKRCKRRTSRAAVQFKVTSLAAPNKERARTDEVRGGVDGTVVTCCLSASFCKCCHQNHLQIAGGGGGVERKDSQPSGGYQSMQRSISLPPPPPAASCPRHVCGGDGRSLFGRDDGRLFV